MTSGGSGVGVLTTDRHLVVRSWDPWLVEATGVPEGAACGRPLVELFPEIAERNLVPRLRRVIDEGAVEVLAPAFHRYLIPCAPRVPSAFFTRMQQHVTISPLRSGEGTDGVVITLEDVTARLEQERELAAELRSQDDAIRLRATQMLADVEAEPAVLAEALADSYWRVRRSAAEGLARRRGGEAVATLVEAVRERHRDLGGLNAALTALALTDEDVVPPVLELLRAGDAEVRTYAALALGQLRDARAVPELARLIHDEDVNVGYHAIEALGRIADRAAVEPLAAVVQSRDFYLSFAALEALSAIGEPSVAPQLMPLLDDELLRPAAVRALGRLGSEDAVGPLVAVLARPDAPVAETAEALATLHARFEDAYGEGALVADLARAAAAPEAVAAIAAAVPGATDGELAALARVLGWLPFDGVDRLLARLLTHAGIRRQVAETLAGRGATAVDPLLEALGADDPEVRKAAAMALGRIGAPQAVPDLVAACDGPPDVAVVAAGALGAIGDRRAFEPLLPLLDHPMAALRQAAVAALNSIGHPEMPARIADLLHAKSPRVRESAIRIAGYFGYRDCLDSVLELCRDPEEEVRRAAVEQLPQLEDPRAATVLVSALGDPAAQVRAAAARALAQVPAPEAGAPLRTALDDRDPWVRYHAARSAGQQRAETLVERLVELALADTMPPVRIAAVEAIAEIAPSGVLPTLERLASDADPEVARAAVAALGRLPEPQVVARLVETLASGDAGLRLAALAALGHRRAAEVVAEIARVAREDVDQNERRLALAALAGIGGERAIGALVEALGDAECRDEAIRLLGRADEQQLDWLGRGLRHADRVVRCGVVEALARTKHERAARLLAAALDDPAADVRYAAARALGRMDLRGAERRLRAIAGTDEHPAVRDAAHGALTRSPA